MRLPRQETLFDWLKAFALWSALGGSLGLYYRFSAGGARGWPLPHPESLAAAVMHYAGSGDALTGTQQVWYWMLSFPVIGLLWVAILTVLAPQFDGRKSVFSVSLVRSGAAAAPISILGLWLMKQAAQAPDGFQLGRLMDVATGHSFARPSPYMDYAYAVAALVALAIEIRMFSTAFDLHGRRAIRHTFVSTAVLAAVAFAIGKGVSFALTA